MSRKRRRVAEEDAEEIDQIHKELEILENAGHATKVDQDDGEDKSTDKHSKLLSRYQRALKSKKKIITKENDSKQRNNSIPVVGLQPLPVPDTADTRSNRNKAVETSKSEDDWIVEPTYVRQDASKKFTQLGLSEKMLAALKSLGISKAFAVQTAVIPLLLAEDAELCPDAREAVLVNAATGSGKTLAYSIPVVESLTGRVVPRIRAIVVVPTRVLVQQVRSVMENVARGSGLRVAGLRADRPFQEEQQLLTRTSPDIIVTTPGRLVDHIRETSSFDLSSLRYIIIDEADRLLGQTFQDWVDVVLEAVHKKSRSADMGVEGSVISCTYRTRPQMLVFSATLTRDSGKWAALGIRTPRVIVVGGKEQFSIPPTLEEYIVPVRESTEKPLTLAVLLTNELLPKHCVIFTRSGEGAVRLGRLLSLLLPDVRIGAITGETSDAVRRRRVRELASGEVDVVVCTDVFARGMDVQGVTIVINYDVPLSAREYVHRVGRTARAGASGSAWTLVERPEGRWFKSVMSTISRSHHSTPMRRELPFPSDQTRESYKAALESLARDVGAFGN
ncbi:P-loop containing nucleoside triphosphate hydrolase protein [Dipodascopsis uninucleata]